MQDDLLRSQRDGGAFLRRERQRFILAVTVQRLGAAEDSGQRLKRDADDVVIRLLRGQGTAGCLRVETQVLGTRVGGSKPLSHAPRPQAPGRAELGNLLQEVVVGIEKE